MIYLWKHYFKKNYKTFDSFLEKIKLTIRNWNKKTDLIYALKYISWTFNLNINILTFKTCKHLFKCYNHLTCFLIIYKFQNSALKIFNNFNSMSIDLFFYKNNLYKLLPSTTFPLFYPYLINKLGFNKLTFNKCEISVNQIIQIIKQNFTDVFPFSIKIYTAYYFVNVCFTQQIKNNFIGHYKSSDSDEIAYIFLNPSLNGNQFSICFLHSKLQDSEKFCKKNIFSNTHVSEGTKLSEFKSYKNKSLKEDSLLNQEFCICDHPSTLRLNSTRKNLNIKNLASTLDQKYFLQENLGKNFFLKHYLCKCLILLIFFS